MSVGLDINCQKNTKLVTKALDYDKKAAKLTKKAEKAHAERDLETSNRKATRAARLDKKAASLSKKAAKSDNDFRQASLERKAEKAKYKAAKARVDANRISRTTGYGAKAMKYAIKSDIAAKKAAKARARIANNEYYVKRMKRKISSLSPEELNGAYSFVKELTQS